MAPTARCGPTASRRLTNARSTSAGALAGAARTPRICRDDGALIGVHGAFITLARQACPQLDELLLTLAAQFRPVDSRGAFQRLDDYSR